MEKAAPRYFAARVAEPVPRNSPAKNAYKRVLVECNDASATEDDVREAIRDFVEFPPEREMDWCEFGPINADEPATPGREAPMGMRLWLVKKPEH